MNTQTMYQGRVEDDYYLLKNINRLDKIEKNVITDMVLLRLDAKQIARRNNIKPFSIYGIYAKAVLKTSDLHMTE